ncbi:MAG: alpha/beta hydrolase, partial [Methylotenera sp.]|nr:alpha/beta hydrolase [Methylotenera sp.]
TLELMHSNCIYTELFTGSTEGSITLYKHLKNAQLVLYPDSGHGSIFQYHDSFVNTANFFLGH